MKAKLKQIFQVVGCAASGAFFFCLAAIYAFASNWLLTGIFEFFATCGFIASFIFATSTQQESRGSNDSI